MARQRESKKMIRLPIAKSLPDYSGPVYLADLIVWLETEKADADAYRNSETADANDVVFWAGYGDALTNVLHHLTGPGE